VWDARWAPLDQGEVDVSYPILVSTDR
jgi:hypothetical protein